MKVIKRNGLEVDFNPEKIKNAISKANAEVEDMDKLDTKGQPGDCIGCAACESHCPQGIAISKIMEELAEKTAK